MFVPPFFPPPIEVRQSVADGPNRERLAFVRKTLFGVNAGMALTHLSSHVPLPAQLDSIVVILFFISLALLAGVRTWTKKWRIRLPIDLVFGLPCILLLGAALRTQYEGLPLWIFATVPLTAYFYAVCSGRDMSFIAMFFLSWLVSTALWVGAGYMGLTSTSAYIWGLMLLLAWSFYLVCDLSMILRRRKSHEFVESTFDVFRDVLNIFMYFVRVGRHWNRHRLWAK